MRHLMTDNDCLTNGGVSITKMWEIINHAKSHYLTGSDVRSLLVMLYACLSPTMSKLYLQDDDER